MPLPADVLLNARTVMPSALSAAMAPAMVVLSVCDGASPNHTISRLEPARHGVFSAVTRSASKPASG